MEVESIGQILGIAAALIHLLGYITYNVLVPRPAKASWLIWSGISIMNAFTFKEMTSWFLAMQFFVGSLASVVTFGLSYFRGKFESQKLSHLDWLAIGCGYIAAILWLYFHEAEWANVLIFVALAFGFIPYYQILPKDPTKEVPLPWFIWTSAFLITLTNVIIQDKNTFAYVLPVGGALAHLSVGILASRRPNKKSFY